MAEYSPTLPAALETPLLEQIAQAVETRLQEVTVANGYLVNLVRPRRLKGRQMQFADFETIIEVGDPVQQGDENQVDNSWAVQFDVSTFYNIPNEPNETEDPGSIQPIDQILIQILASVQVAVKREEKWGLDGFVLRTEYANPEFLGNADLACCCTTFTVYYEHKRGDPTSPV